MNTKQIEIMQIVLNSSTDKAEFLANVLAHSSQSYDEAVRNDSQRIGGEVTFHSVSEAPGLFYGKRQINECVNSGGNLYKSVNHKLREPKTYRDFDWSKLEKA